MSNKDFSKFNLEKLAAGYYGLDGSSAPIDIRAGRWWRLNRHGDKLPSKVSYQDLELWRDTGRRVIARSVLASLTAGLCLLLPLRCISNLADAECRTFQYTEFGDKRFDAYLAVRDVIVNEHYSDEDLYDHFMNGSADVDACNPLTIARLEREAYEHKYNIDDPTTPSAAVSTTTTEASIATTTLPG